MVSEASGRSPSDKAFHLVALLRGDAADILEKLSEVQRHNLDSFLKALELQLREKCTKEFSCLQLKACYWKAGESLQGLAMDIQRLSHLAFLDCPVETCEDLALQHSINSVWDLETQKVLRLGDLKNIASALVYVHKIEAAQ